MPNSTEHQVSVLCQCLVWFQGSCLVAIWGCADHSPFKSGRTSEGLIPEVVWLIILVVKRYIYTAKWSNGRIDLADALHPIRVVENLESVIAIKNNKLNLDVLKWGPL